MTKKYEYYTREQLLEEIKKLKKQKKFGLVWEDKPEQVVEDCKNNFPVLTEVSDKAISEAENSPTHLIIEGDNFHSLSVLNVTHKGKIDVIYIDPPYNTGARDWKYNNDYVESEDSFRHSKWLSMMKKRLNLARNLLTEDGIIICAIDHYEVYYLGAIMDEVFREENRLGIVSVVHKPEGRNQEKFFGTSNEFALFYAKDKKKANFNQIAIDAETADLFTEIDEKGKYRLKNFIRTADGKYATREAKPNFYYPIYVSPNLQNITLERQEDYYEVFPIIKSGVERTWKTLPKTFLEYLNNGTIIATKSDDRVEIYEKLYENQVIRTHWIKKEYHAYHFGTKIIDKILGEKKFNFPKSLFLIQDILKLVSRKNSIILDFFAGSGTTGHAVLELNKEDGGNRQFILCTNNENAICEEVTYPRIKTVITGKRTDGTNYSDGIPANLRYFKTDFIEKSEDTDENRISLTKRCYELLQIKESCYESQKSSIESLKIWRSDNKLLAVIFDRYDKTDNQKYISEITGFARNSDDVVVYRFSIDGNLDMDISALKNARLEEIPEEILKTFNQIFKPKKKRK